MDSVNANVVSEDILASKIDTSTSCDQSIQLTKMEIVDNQSDVHLESANSQHMVETQFINIHRVSDLKNLMADSIPPELLSHHVVDLGSNPEYSQHIVTNAQFYDNADFLSQSFTDEDRRLGLVAVQLIQSNRNNNSPSESTMHNDMLNGKNTLPSVSSLSAEKSVMSTIVPNYVQTVSRNQSPMNIHIPSNHNQVTDHHISKDSEPHSNQIIKLYQPLIQENKLQALPPLKKINQPLTTTNSKYLTTEGSSCNSQSIIVSTDLNPMQPMAHQISEPLSDIKTECVTGESPSDVSESVPAEEYDSENENEARSSQKRLPHKKRIPSKLKKALTATPTRNIHAKCYKCTKCGEQFPTQSTFNNHKQQHSSKKMVYACELCNKTCTNQLKFFEHLKSHYEPGARLENMKTETMEPVESQFEQNTDVQSPPPEGSENELQIAENQDRSMYSTEQNKVLTCGKCGWVFRRQKAFDCHMSISHPKQEEIEEFSEPEDMMEGIRHVVNMVPTGDEEDKNYEPWQSPKSVDNIVMSQRTTNSEPPPAPATKILQSPKNPPTAKKKDAFTDEEINAKPRKEMSCPHCERTFVHRNSLLYHIRSHTGHRPHQCELCGKSFFAAGALKIHLRLHSGDKPYKCEYCGRFFRQWGDLKYHITSLHSNTKMFQCEYCGKDFARKYSLVVHRRIHTGEKNYICEYCTKTFRAASYLQNHRRIHTGEKPHMCQVCGKPFRVRSDMKRHMKTHPDVNVVNVLTELSSNTSENNSEVRDMSCLVNNQELTIPKQENISNSVVADQDSEQNIKPIITESGAPLNLNVRPDNAQELFNYPRDSLEDDRENANTGTLYVWIQTNSDTIIHDA